MGTGSLWERKDGSLWRSIKIPSNQEFLQQYHQWIYKKVADRFRRDKDRVQDTVQNVRIRLLSKDFIGRWFFKHLTHELVDRVQAEHMLGQKQLKFISSIKPVVGLRAEPDSLWRVSDILEYAKFDHERYFYSIQGHTINSDRMLSLLGYGPGQYNALKSLYTQGRIRPSELTGHTCVEDGEVEETIDGKCSVPGCGKKHFCRGFCSSHYHSQRARCPVCEKGRANLRARGVSLADDWMSSENVADLRWDDSQLRPFLRKWQNKNMIKSVPGSIVRPEGCDSPYKGIDAGLLKYAWIIINNEVVNDFKRMSRTFDASSMVFNDGVSPDGPSQAAWDVDDDGVRTQVIQDLSAMDEFSHVENRIDVARMADLADLSSEERNVIVEIDLNETNIKRYAESIGESVIQVQKVRTSALSKMRNSDVSNSMIDSMIDSICKSCGCSMDDLLGDSKFGPCVPARMKLFSKMADMGFSIDEMEFRTGLSKDRITMLVDRSLAL